MARIIIYLRDQEVIALQKLAQLEYRAPKAQAALIIRKELERLGMVSAESNDGDEHTALSIGEDELSIEDAIRGNTTS